MNSILNRIAQSKLKEIALAKKKTPLKSLQRASAMQQRDFIAALLRSKSAAIIAEIKKASPSKGLICEDFDVVRIAKAYAEHGARCLSVLTDTEFFQGNPDYIATAKAHCDLPVLRKDFIMDTYQIHESWALGADCILLIVDLLNDEQLLEFCLLAHELDMAVLVESHTKQELTRALRLPTPLIGINNRSLHDFSIDIQRTIELVPDIPKDKIVICESGIYTHKDIQLMQAHGINTFLVGESLMRARDIGQALSGLINGESF